MQNHTIPLEESACTAFCIDCSNKHLIGYNLDWLLDDGQVFVNKWGVKKTTFCSKNHKSNKPVTWISKYGSITFTQYGCEFATSGINEAGLVANTLMLDNTVYPEPNDHPSIFISQWLQYQLDNFETVKEVLANTAKIQIRKSDAQWGVHFFVSDSNGDCAAIEFLDRKVVCHTRNLMPVKVLTNTTYAESIQLLLHNIPPQQNMYYSAERFTATAKMLKEYDSTNHRPSIDYAFQVLAKASEGELDVIDGVKMQTWYGGQWSIVYDPKDRRIYFKTITHPNIKHIDLFKFDFACKTSVKVLDMNTELAGDVSEKFVDYTPQINGGVLRNPSVYREIGLTDSLCEALLKYPESTTCTQ